MVEDPCGGAGLSPGQLRRSRLRKLSDPPRTCPLISPDWCRGTTRDRGSRSSGHPHLGSPSPEVTHHGALNTWDGAPDEVVELQSSQTARGCAGGKTHPTPPTHTLTAPLEPPSAWGQGSSLPGEHPSGSGNPDTLWKGWEGTSRRLAAPLDTLRGLMAQGKATCYLTQPHSCSSTGLAHWTG